MEEFEPFHWYINDQSAKTFLVTLIFFALSLLLLIFLFLRFIHMHASFPDIIIDHEVSNSITTRQNIIQRRQDEMMSSSNVIHHHVVAAPSSECSGVDVEVIKNLPVFVHRLSESGSDNTRFKGSEDCCICLGVFEDREIIKVMPQCLHAFHSHCIDRWLISRSTCPLCRSSVDSTSGFSF